MNLMRDPLLTLLDVISAHDSDGLSCYLMCAVNNSLIAELSLMADGVGLVL